jgi:hypothetical protein
MSSRVAKAGNRVGGLGPQLGIGFGSTRPTAYEPQSASGSGPNGECNLPLHPSTIAAELLMLARYGVGL